MTGQVPVGWVPAVSTHVTEQWHVVVGSPDVGEAVETLCGLPVRVTEVTPIVYRHCQGCMDKLREQQRQE